MVGLCLGSVRSQTVNLCLSREGLFPLGLPLGTGRFVDKTENENLTANKLCLRRVFRKHMAAGAVGLEHTPCLPWLEDRLAHHTCTQTFTS